MAKQRIKGVSDRNPKQEAFLSAYRECGNITQAAKIAGIDRGSHHRWIGDDAEYAARFAEAHEDAADLLEAEARRRAVSGVEEPVFYQGAQCGYVQRYSDTLLIVLLKAVRPEKFRERYDHQHSGKGGGPVQLQIVEEVVDLPPAADAGPQ